MSWESIIVCAIVFGIPYLLLALTEAQPGKPLAITRYYWLNVTLGLLILPVVALLGYALFGVAGFVMVAPVMVGLDLLIEFGFGWVVLVGLGILALWAAYSVGKQEGHRQTMREVGTDPEVALQVYLAALLEPKPERVDMAAAKQELRARRRRRQEG